MTTRPQVRVKAYPIRPVGALDKTGPTPSLSAQVVTSETVMRMHELWALALVVVVPVVLIAMGAVTLAIAVPFLPAARRRPALQAIDRLTTLARVLRSRGP